MGRLGQKYVYFALHFSVVDSISVQINIVITFVNGVTK